MDALAKRQSVVLRTIISFTLREGFAPSIRELCDALGTRSTNGMEEHLRALERKGAIRRRAGTSRSITLTPEALAVFGDPRDLRTRNAALLEALKTVLASAHPNPVDHPSMTRAWEQARLVVESEEAA